MPELYNIYGWTTQVRYPVHVPDAGFSFSKISKSSIRLDRHQGSCSSRVVDHLHGSLQPSSRAAQSHGKWTTRSQTLFARCGRIRMVSIDLLHFLFHFRPHAHWLDSSIAVETAAVVVPTTAHHPMSSVLVSIKGTFYLNIFRRLPQN